MIGVANIIKNLIRLVYSRWF